MVFSNALMRPKLDKDALQWTLELVKEIESCWKRTGIIIDDNNVNQALLENKEIINLPNWMFLARFHQELDSILQDDRTLDIILKDLDNLKYCESNIKEVSRLQHIIPQIFVYSEDDEIGGYIWPANTMLQLFMGQYLNVLRHGMNL
ncbi:cytochrome P450 [Gigaspora margarita]|uniref:Cytochrome P450 n=1 Tax=Gigaspora margarita TaxID=4874 RepID=A0A8H4AT81_GIGMA|nr:cytochrome P450 [Gigaspora margarita]